MIQRDHSFFNRRVYGSALLLLLLTGWSATLHAQTPKPSFTLYSNESASDSSRNYQASNFVKLIKGFHYYATPSSGKHLKAIINKGLSFTIVNVTNPVVGDTTTNASQSPYIPGGGTYSSSDPSQTISSIATPSKVKTSGSGGGTITRNDTVILSPLLWFKTVPQNNNLNGGYHWRDVTGNAAKVLRYSALGAGNGTEVFLTRNQLRAYNFNPAMDFSIENISKEILINKSNLSQATIIGLWGAKQDFKKDEFIFALNGRRNESVLFSKSSLIEADSSKTNLMLSTDNNKSLLFNGDTTNVSKYNNYRETALRVASYYKINRPNTSLWGETQKAVISMGAPFSATNVNNTSVFKNPPVQDAFKGYTPELLVFNQALTPSQCNRFESYLALKYGVSLRNSYTALNGDTLWNYTVKSADTIYNHRITGYGREDGLGFCQQLATTSYEEAPYFTDQTINDSYFRGDSYNPSSPNRLLVMGNAPGNMPDNGRYVLFGDNGDSIKVNSTVAPSGYNGGIARKWQVRTNAGAPSQPVLSWIDNGLFKTTTTGVKTTIYKKASTGTVWAVTKDSLKGTSGYFGWMVEEEYGPLVVKFSTDKTGQDHSNDYGYKIDSIGRVFPILNGVLSGSNLFSVEKGQKVEVEKSGRLLALRINGVRYKETEFYINTPAGQPFYGYVEIGPNKYDVAMRNFRHGGFVDTGHRLELSYAPGKASGFAPYTNGRTWLLVDRSGTGNFGNPEAYVSDEVDVVRSKIIFNNVYWDTDGNGKDVFTFAYKLSGGNGVNKKKPFVSDEIQAPAKEELLIYYPNPRQTSLVAVRLRTTHPTPSIITVYDIAGRKVFVKELPASSDVQLTEIPLQVEGLYIVNVTNNETNHSQKIVCKRQ